MFGAICKGIQDNIEKRDIKTKIFFIVLEEKIIMKSFNFKGVNLSRKGKKNIHNRNEAKKAYQGKGIKEYEQRLRIV